MVQTQPLEMPHDPLSLMCQVLSCCAALLVSAGIQRQQLVMLLPMLLAPGKRRMELMPGKLLDAENSRQHARQPAKARLPEKRFYGAKPLFFEERAELFGMGMPLDQ